MPQISKEVTNITNGDSVKNTFQLDDGFNNQESKRKTLHEQLQESKELKQLEHQRMLESKNSSYKLDEESANFYGKLKAREIEKDQLIKQNERIELENYAKLKQESLKLKESKKSKNMSFVNLSKNKLTPIIKKKNNIQENIQTLNDLVNSDGNKEKLNQIIKNSNVIKSSDVQMSNENSQLQSQKEIINENKTKPILAGYESSSEEEDNDNGKD